MKKGLEQFKKEAERLRVKIYNLEHQEMEEKVLPEAKKLIGQCYKYRNSYGGDREPWWLYQKIVSIKSISDENRVWVKVNTFQKDCYEDVNFKKQDLAIRNLRGDFYQKITTEEYEMEKKKLVEILNKL